MASKRQQVAVNAEAAVEAPSVPVEALPPLPSAEVAQGGINALVAALKAAIARGVERLPPELRGNAFIIEQVLNQEFDKIAFGSWRGTIIAEAVAAIQSGKSEVRHDPTELA